MYSHVIDDVVAVVIVDVGNCDDFVVCILIREMISMARENIIHLSGCCLCLSVYMNVCFYQ